MAVKKLAPKKSTKQLKAEAESNTTVSKKKGRSEPETIKEGNPLDQTIKTEPRNQSDLPRMGLSAGVTLNMGDFQSLRIDCWLSDVVQPDESPEYVAERLADIIQNQLEVCSERFTIE